MEMWKILTTIDDQIMVAQSKAIQAEDKKKFSKMLEWELVMYSLEDLRQMIIQGKQEKINASLG
jgi:hypothetical protein